MGEFALRGVDEGRELTFCLSVVRSIDMPRSYGWDSPSQRMGMGMGMGSHLV